MRYGDANSTRGSFSVAVRHAHFPVANAFYSFVCLSTGSLLAKEPNGEFIAEEQLANRGGRALEGRRFGSCPRAVRRSPPFFVLESALPLPSSLALRRP